MESRTESGVFKPASHPLAFPTCREGNGIVYSEAASSSRVFHDLQDSKEASRSFEMGDVPVENADERVQETVAIRTTAPRCKHPPTAASSKQEQWSAAVHIDLHRSHTVSAAAAAKKKEEEAAQEPLTAENETWGHWSFRHVWNGFVMLMMGLYQVVQAGARHEPVDMKTISYTNSVYISAPPRAEKLKKAGAQGNAEASP
jgi:hypothetical protein